MNATMSGGQNLAWALAYAQKLGLPVFPVYGIRGAICDCGALDCHSPGKHPCTPSGVKNASIGEAQIREWWKRWPNANIALATGEASGVFVLDVDAPDGEASLAALIEKHGALPDVAHSRTGGGGHQYFFAYPYDPIVRNSAGRLGVNLDIRAEGGYVVLPPSQHVSGRPYVWEKGRSLGEIGRVDAPAWLIAAIAHRPDEPEGTTELLKDDVIPAGKRNDVLYRKARAMRARRFSQDAITAAIMTENRARCLPPLSEEEVRALVQNAFSQPDRADFRAADAEIARIASIADPLSRAREIKTYAKAQNVPVAAVKEALRQAAKLHPTAEPQAKAPQWAAPVAVHDQPVSGVELLTDLRTAISQFVLIEATSNLIIALWVLFTWVFEQVAETNPYLRVVSPAPECGKSTLLKVISRLCRSGFLRSRITPSVFTRKMSVERMTLLLDEGDAFLHENEIMRNLLDCANDPDTAIVSLSIKSGDDWIPADFNCFTPIVLASIGTLRNMQTVESRSISVSLKRGTKAELKRLAKARARTLRQVLDPIAARCARWAKDNVAALADANPDLPDNLSGREQDKWSPLIAIADLISPEMGAAARQAAGEACGQVSADSTPLGALLLGDIRTWFEDSEKDRVSSRELVAALVSEGSRWAEYGRARKPLSQTQLARLLSTFGISSHTVRISDSTLKGYERKDFADAWARYLPDEKNSDTPIFGDPNRHNATTVEGVGRNGDFQSATEDSCGGSKNGTSPYSESGCGVVTDRNGKNTCISVFPAPESLAEAAENDRLAAPGGFEDLER